jgi:hypothetical protein
MNPGASAFREKNTNDNARESGARSEIQPSIGCTAVFMYVDAILYVSVPYIGETSLGD